MAALEQLHELMRDQSVTMRVRLNSAISASRVEPLAMPGEETTPAVAFLRNILTLRHHGKPYQATWRKEAAAALAYYERRARKAELQYEVPDQAERSAAWKRNLDSLLRQYLWTEGRWPHDKAALHGDAWHALAADPELALAAILVPAEQRRKTRQKAIDQPIAQHINTDGQRQDILRHVANSLYQRIMEHADEPENPRLEAG
jgi:hypothetical protein